MRRPALFIHSFSFLAPSLCKFFFSPRPVYADEPPTTPILRIEAGMHTATINRISVDMAGRLVLTVSHDKTARLWELPSGKLLRVLRPPLGDGNEGQLFAGALSPDGRLAAVGGWTGYDWNLTPSVYLFDTSTGQMVRRLPGLPGAIKDLAFSSQGRFLAAVLGGGGGGLRVWETDTGRELGKDADYGGGNSFGVDWYGEDRLVTACYDGQLRLYRFTVEKSLTLQTKKAVKGGKELHGVRFSPDGRRIAVGFNDSNAAAVVDGHDLSFLFAPDTTGVENGWLGSVSWTNDGATLAAGGRWDSGNGDPIRRWSKFGRGRAEDTVVVRHTITDLRSLSGGSLLFGAAGPAWGVLRPDGTCQVLGASPIADHRSILGGFRFSKDGATAAFSYEDGGRAPARFAISSRDLRLETDSELQPESQEGWNSPRTEGLPLTDWKNTTAPKLNGWPLALGNSEISRSLAISRDASSFLLGAESSLRSFKAEGTERWKVDAPSIAWGVNLADNDRLAVAAYGDGTIRWYRADTGQELLALFLHADRKRWVMWAPLVAGERPQGDSMGIVFQMHNAEIEVVNAGSAAQRAGIQKGDRITKLGSEPVTDGGSLRAAVKRQQPGITLPLAFQRGEKEITTTITLGAPPPVPVVKGYFYDCSPGGEDLIGWHVNRGKDHEADFFPAAKFRDEFYRPDVIQRVLQTRDVALALQQANETSGRKPQSTASIETVVQKMAPPVVAFSGINATATLELAEGSDTVTVHYTVRSAASPATHVRLLLNGRPLAVEAPVPGNETTSVSASFAAPAQDAILSLLAENPYAVSEPATLRLVHPLGTNHAAVSEAMPDELKPRLFVLSVGVGNLKMNDAFDLNGDGFTSQEELLKADPKGTVLFADLAFPAKDAIALAAAFKAQQGGLFKEVQTKVLADADSREILKGLDWIQKSGTNRDVCIVFLAGHGDCDSQGHCFFVPTDYDPAQRNATGVSFEAIKNTLAAIPGKVVCFADTCHSGKLATTRGAAMDMNRLVNELASAENGIAVLASCTGRQVSYEDAKWGHGAFTFALLEGIAEGRADLFHKGTITLSNLDAYVCNRVPELIQDIPILRAANLTQNPAIGSPNTLPDFPLATKR